MALKMITSTKRNGDLIVTFIGREQYGRFEVSCFDCHNVIRIRILVDEIEVYGNEKFDIVAKRMLPELLRHTMRGLFEIYDRVVILARARDFAVHFHYVFRHMYLDFVENKLFNPSNKKLSLKVQ